MIMASTEVIRKHARCVGSRQTYTYYLLNSKGAHQCSRQKLNLVVLKSLQEQTYHIALLSSWVELCSEQVVDVPASLYHDECVCVCVCLCVEVKLDSSMHPETQWDGHLIGLKCTMYQFLYGVCKNVCRSILR